MLIEIKTVFLQLDTIQILLNKTKSKKVNAKPDIIDINY